MTDARIDGRDICVEEGTTILEAANRLGIKIPSLCHHPSLRSGGSCGVCLVEVEGRDGFVTACTETVKQGIRVRTDTDGVLRARSDAIDLLMLRHPNECHSCERTGECDLARLYFDNSLRCARDESPARGETPVSIGPRVHMRSDRCIACGRCVSFTNDVVGSREIEIVREGGYARMRAMPHLRLANPYSLCTVDLCPTGALTPSELRLTSSAWRLTSAPAICVGCSTGCSAILDHDGERAVRLRPAHGCSSVPGMCDEGRASVRELCESARALAPLVLEDCRMRGTTWQDAERRIAGMFRGSGVEEVAIVLSARASMEENLAFLKLGREAFRSPRFFYSGRDADPSFEDGILRHSDRNPNAAGVALMAEAGLSGLPRGSGLIVLDGLATRDLITAVEARPSWAILVTSADIGMQRWADVVLPKAAHFEQEGTFLTAGGRMKRVDEALEPAGESKTAWEIAGTIARALGRAFDGSSAHDMRVWGSWSVAGLGGFDELNATHEGVDWSITR